MKSNVLKPVSRIIVQVFHKCMTSRNIATLTHVTADQKVAVSHSFMMKNSTENTLCILNGQVSHKDKLYYESFDELFLLSLLWASIIGQTKSCGYFSHAGPIFIKDLNLIITVLADVLKPNGIRPQTSPELIGMVSSKCLSIIPIWSDDIIQNDQYDVLNSNGTQNFHDVFEGISISPQYPFVLPTIWITW